MVLRSVPFQRFEAAVRALIPDWVSDNTAPPLLLAVSGGADSLAMMHMAATCFPGRVSAMTVDHQLRSEAADEAQYVAALALDLSIPHCVATPREPITGNLQSAARAERYALLTAEARRLGGSFIATAHHADDQLETILMRLSRGSGVGGLSGIRPINGSIIRPLLGFRKHELESICADAGIIPMEDPSNMDTQFDRVRMRMALASIDLPITALALERSAKALREADAALDWTVRQMLPERITCGAEQDLFVDVCDLPPELMRRLFECALATAGETNVRGEQIDMAMATLCANKPACLGQLLIRPCGRDAPKWHLSPAPPRKVRG